MRKLTICPCGCGEKVLENLPYKAQRLKMRRFKRADALRNQAVNERKQAMKEQIQAALKRGLQLATAPVGGNA